MFSERQIEIGNATIDDISYTLSKPPFNIKDKKQNFLFARYLVEDNNETYVELDKFQENDINIIKSVFKKALNNFMLQSDIDVALTHNSINTLMFKYKNGFEQALQTCNGKIKKEFYTLEEFENAFRFLEINMNPEQMNYIECELYKNSKKLNEYQSHDLINILYEMEVPDIQNNSYENNFDENFLSRISALAGLNQD